MDYPCETNYDFLRQHYPHQVKGSKFDDFLSARFTSSPTQFYIQFLIVMRAYPMGSKS